MNYMVVAYDKNRGIGANNDLLWQRDLPADLAHFKQLTLGASIIMGRRTFESIGQVLPGRENIVVSRSSVDSPGITCVNSVEQAFAHAKNPNVAVVGGASVYEQALPFVEAVYATEVMAAFALAQVFFTELPPDFVEVSRESHVEDERNKYPYDFVEYRRPS